MLEQVKHVKLCLLTDLVSCEPRGVSANTSCMWIYDQRKGETSPHIPSTDFPRGADSETRQEDLKAHFIIRSQTSFRPSGNHADMLPVIVWFSGFSA